MFRPENINFGEREMPRKETKVDKNLLLEEMYPQKSPDEANLKAALETLVEGSSFGWEDVSKALIQGKRSEIKNLVEKYLRDWRATDNEKLRRIKEHQAKFEELLGIQSE